MIKNEGRFDSHFSDYSDFIRDILGKNLGVVLNRISVHTLSIDKVLDKIGNFNKIKKEFIEYCEYGSCEVYSFFHKFLKIYLVVNYSNNPVSGKLLSLSKNGNRIDNDESKSSVSVDILWSNGEVKNIDDFIFSIVLDLKETCSVDEKIESDDVNVGVITNSVTGLRLYNIDINKKVGDFNNLDLHYGEGFENFYNNIVDVISNKTYGLVLFHGIPGSGKTYCIRNIIKDVKNKQFIFVPKVIIQNILSPDFASFLLNYILNLKECVSSERKNMVLILEDAEDILRSRDDSIDSSSVSNILNLTDGILNNILDIQIICTFNTDESNIDKALLRNGRLLVRKEFKKVSKERAKILLKLLNKDITVPDDGLTLAEIYNSTEDSKPLLHDYDIKNIEKGFGFITNKNGGYFG